MGAKPLSPYLDFHQTHSRRVIINPYVFSASNPLLVNLVAYWKLDEASGNVLDSGTNGVNLTETGTLGSAAGIISTCRTNNGGANYASVASNSFVETGDIDFTFCLWVNMTSVGANTVAIGKDGSGITRDYDILPSPPFYGGPTFTVIRGGSEVNATRSGALSTGAWHNIIAWHDSVADTVNIQVDGGSVVSQATGGALDAPTSSPFALFRRTFSPFEGPLDGNLDEIGFWKRVLTTGERADLYNAGSGLTYPF